MLMLEYRIPPNVVTFNTMLNCYGKQGDWKTMERFFEKYVGRHGDVVTYTTLINVFGKKGNFSISYSLFGLTYQYCIGL